MSVSKFVIIAAAITVFHTCVLLASAQTCADEIVINNFNRGPRQINREVDVTG